MTTVQDPLVRQTAVRSRRSFRMNQMRVWHWVSSAVCLSGFLLFTITGITLNHASEIPASLSIKRGKVRLPGDLQALLRQSGGDGKRRVPAPIEEYLRNEVGMTLPLPPAEWNGGEVYVSQSRPGGDAWASLDADSGMVEYERTDRGWVAYLNDLHKGRHTGRAWLIFIDVLAAACLTFCVTGVGLLFLHAAKRPSTWPAVAFGLAIPVAMALLFIH